MVRILAIAVFAFLAQFVLRQLGRFTRWVLSGKRAKDPLLAGHDFSRRYPRLASLLTIIMGAATFAIYSTAVGLMLKEFNVSLAAYLASA